jgi:hypothetical protein
MEMHDSWLLEVVCNPDGAGYAVFHGVVYRSEGRVFQDAQESGYQDVRFDFEEMRIEGEVGELKTWASDGELWIDGKNENGIIYLPADHTAELCLEICLADDFRTLKIHASQVSSAFIGEFELEAHWDSARNRTRANA